MHVLTYMIDMCNDKLKWGSNSHTFFIIDWLGAITSSSASFSQINYLISIL